MGVGVRWKAINERLMVMQGLSDHAFGAGFKRTSKDGDSRLK
jgi:hypothetical protein